MRAAKTVEAVKGALTEFVLSLPVENPNATPLDYATLCRQHTERMLDILYPVERERLRAPAEKLFEEVRG